jgi:hypothetical protein
MTLNFLSELMTLDFLIELMTHHTRCFDVLGLEAEAYEAGWELLEAGDAGEDL